MERKVITRHKHFSISVIIPTYNCSSYVCEAIDSVLSQTYQPLEIIVVDDGSTDNTKESLKSYIENRKIKYFYQENKGPSSARNKGIREAHGEYISFLDADDVWFSFKLELQIQHQLNNPNIFALSTTMLHYDEKNNLFSYSRDIQFKSYFFEDMLIRNYMGSFNTAFIRADVLRKIGGFREDLLISEDHELWLRLAKMGELHKIVFPTVMYRIRTDGLSAGNRDNTTEKNFIFIKELFRKQYPDYKNLYLGKSLSLNYFHSSIDQSELENHIKAMKYLLFSIIYHPFRFPEKTSYRLLRLRRFIRISKDIIFRKSYSKHEDLLNKKRNSYKVAILSSGLGHVKRGIEAWAEDLGNVLRNKGLRVTVYKGGGNGVSRHEKVISCVRRDSELAKRLIDLMPSFGWRFGFGSRYQMEETTFTLNLLPEIMQKKFDIIHTQDPSVANILRIAERIGLIKSKVILAHGTEESFDFIKKFNYLQHLAPFHLEEAAQGGVNGAKHFAIPNFVNIEKFNRGLNSHLRKELGIPQDAFVILSVAAIKRHHKRIDYLIDEVTSLNDKNVYLVIAGSRTGETEELIELGKSKLKDRVIFLADFTRERMHEVYKAADVFCLSSLKEMMPIALLEALSSGLPSIVNRHPVVEWMVGEGGESIDMAKYGELAKTIKKYMYKAYREDRAKKAREKAVANFSEEVVVDKIIDMYEEVLK